jgi:thiol-disulfide isomerase/thioredoxin
MGIGMRGWRIGLAAIFAAGFLASSSYAGTKKSPAAAPTPAASSPQPAKPKRKLMSFTLTDLTGHPVKLSKWHGRRLVVDFWATWCPPCQKEVPELNAIYRKYRARGLIVLGVSVDKVQGDGIKSVVPFAKENKIGYPILMADEALVDAVDIDNLPTTLFINTKGQTVARLEGRGKYGELSAAARTLFHD